MELKTFIAQDLAGNVIPNPLVYLYQVGTNIPISGLENAAGGALSNPFSGNSTGQIQVAAPGGDYDMRVASGIREYVIRVRFIDTTTVAAAQDQADAAAASAAAALAIYGDTIAVQEAVAAAEAAANSPNIVEVLANIDQINLVATGRIPPRIITVSDVSIVTPDAEITDVLSLNSALTSGTLTINAPAGVAFEGQKLVFRILTNNVQTISWNSVYVNSIDLALPIQTTGSGKYDYFCFMFNSIANNWHFLAMMRGF